MNIINPVNKAWAVIDNDGQVFLCSIAYYKNQSLNQFLSFWGADREWWKTCTERGYTLRRITATIAERNK